MEKISVTPEQLKIQAKAYTTARDGIAAEIKKVDQMNQTIQQEWQGQAFKAYLTQYSQLATQVTKFENLLTDINSQLEKYANTVAQRDVQDAKSFGL